MKQFDELKIYRGDDIVIVPNKIIVTQPTINQIIDFGERKYFNAIHNLTGVGADFKWQLWDYKGIDYTTIKDYDLFINFITPIVSSKKRLYEVVMSNPSEYMSKLDELGADELEDLLINPLQLVLKDIDLADFGLYKTKNEDLVLYNPERDITIDTMNYHRIVDAVRRIHKLKRNGEIPANERTKMDLIEDARDDALRLSQQPDKSILQPLISALSVEQGMCGDERIFNMPINMFFDSIRRANKIQDAKSLLQAARSGFADLKNVDRSRFDWTGEL